MLVRFNIKNFLSFPYEEKSQEFSMIAGKVRNKRERVHDVSKLKILKFAAVYGGNAAGKSNLIKAMDFMQRTIIRRLPQGYTSLYCKAKESNIDKASYFEMEILINQKCYSYGFEIILNKGQFISEWLIELHDGGEKVVFTRDILQKQYHFDNYFKDKTLKAKLKGYAEDIAEEDTVLLLPMLSKNKSSLYSRYNEIQIFQDIYSWIKNKLDINHPNAPISDYSYMANKENIEEVYKMVSAFGTGITGVEIVPVELDNVLRKLPKEITKEILEEIEKRIVELKKNGDVEVRLSKGTIMRSNDEFFMLEVSGSGKIECKTIQFKHGKEKNLFEIREESDGTKRILDLIEILLVGASNKTYVIDELDRCLHPRLTYKFIELFLKIAEKREIQLIVTTHESRLLDFDLLRRDEIWFIDKNKMGESNIYSLEEYNTRFDQKIDRAYLEGRYGGVPIFDAVFPIREE